MRLLKCYLCFFILACGVVYGQQIRLGMSVQIEHEEFTSKQALGMIGFDLTAHLENKYVYGGISLGPQNSYYRYFEPSGDARFYGSINRLRLGFFGGVYLLNKEQFKWSLYASVFNGFSFQKRTVYSDVTSTGIYRFQLQPGMKFQFNDFVIGVHYGYTIYTDFSKREQFILGGTVGYVF